MKNEKLISETLSNLAAVLTRSCNDNPDAVLAIHELWCLSHALENRFVGRDVVLAAICNSSDELYKDSK